MSANNGGPAFPRPMSVSHGGVSEHQFSSGDQDGMTLRDWFAGMALQGMLESGLLSKCFDARRQDSNHAKTVSWFASFAAPDAYDIADAMLAEREKEQRS